MKKIILIFLAFVALGCESKSQLTAPEIWKKYTETIGDLESLKKIKTKHSITVFYDEAGNDTSIVYVKYPDKVRQERIHLDGTKIVSILNSDNGVIITNNQIQDITEQEFSRLTKLGLIFPDIYPQKGGYEFKLIREDLYDSKEVYTLLTVVDNDSTVNYIDKETFQMLGSVRNYYETKVIETAKTNDIRYWKTVSVNFGEYSLQVKTVLIEYDIEINDSIFTWETY